MAYSLQIPCILSLGLFLSAGTSIIFWGVGQEFFSGGKTVKKSSVLTTLYRKIPNFKDFTQSWGETKIFSRIPPLPSSDAAISDILSMEIRSYLMMYKAITQAETFTSQNRLLNYKFVGTLSVNTTCYCQLLRCCDDWLMEGMLDTWICLLSASHHKSHFVMMPGGYLTKDLPLSRLVYCVDLEVWSKLAKCVLFMRIVSNARDFDCDWQRVNAFSHCVTLIRVLLSQIISYSDTKVLVLLVMECKRSNVIYVYEIIFLLHTSRSAECSNLFCDLEVLSCVL